MTKQKCDSNSKSNFVSKKTKKFVFSAIVLALPVIQFLIFYVYVNFNSIIMSFQKYEINKDALGYSIQFNGFENFQVAWKKFTECFWMIKNSVMLYALNLLVGITLALLFSYYIYKKHTGSQFFNVILFMPQIISSVVLVLLFKYVVTNAYPQIMKDWFGKEVVGLLANPDTKLATVLVYNIWVSFGVNVLLFSGAMSGINIGIVESAKIDGVSFFREFISITLPQIWPTFTTFVVVGFSGIFTNQMHLFTLFGSEGNELSTLGYYMYINVLNSSLTRVSDYYLNYGQLAAFGLICTCFVLPLTFLLKRVMEKIGPEI